MQLKNHFFKKEYTFSPEVFQNPTREYAPVYFWEWNGVVTQEETDRQLAEMQRLGIRAAYIMPEPKNFRPTTIPTMMEPDYLTPAYLEACQYAVEKAAELDMELWLYDEGGWPSGGACGKVLLKHPELARQHPEHREFTLTTGEVYHPSEDALCAFYRSGKQIHAGDRVALDAVIMEYFIKKIAFERPGDPDFPDLSRRESTEAFLESSHEIYKTYLEKYFGDRMTLVFTDEPALSKPTPFHNDLEDEFQRRTGYSVRPFLPEILGDIPVSEAGAAARIAWFDLCSEVFCKNYFLVEKEWANAHGMAFGGHLSGEDTPLGMMKGGVFHLLRVLRTMDVPGIDLLWRQIYPAEEPKEWCHTAGRKEENRIFPRYAASAAAQAGANRTLTECFSVYGSGVTYAEMRYALNFQAIRGINIFNMAIIPYAREGFLMMGTLPFFIEANPYFAKLATFNQYIERLSYITSLGDHDTTIALYMPICDFWAGEDAEYFGDAFEKLGRVMENANLSFEVIDDDVIKNAGDDALAKGRLAMGYASYDTVVMPPCRRMPEKTKKRLEAFVENGGHVLLTEGKTVPEIMGAKRYKNIAEEIAPALKLSGETAWIRLAKRKLANGNLYFLHNESVSEKTFLIEEKTQFIRLNLETGKAVYPKREKDGLRLVLGSGEMACLWDGDFPAETETFFENEMTLTTPFTFRRTVKFSVGEMQYETTEYKEEGTPIALGDWSEHAGRDFSGSGVYKTKFILPKKEGKLLLDVGEVRYICEAFVNGKSIGVSLAPPYTFMLDAEELLPENTLEICVTNTAANAYEYTKSFDKWADWQTSPYKPLDKMFRQSSLFGGLYGPVRLFY